MSNIMSMDIIYGLGTKLVLYKHEGGISVLRQGQAEDENSFIPGSEGRSSYLASRGPSFTISPDEIVTLINWYCYRKECGAPIFGMEESTVNDMRAFLKMIRADALPEPAHSLFERLNEQLNSKT